MASLPSFFVRGLIDSILTIWLRSMPTKANNKNQREVPMKLHGYFRSSAAYRVRIALNLKGLSADHLPHHLRKGEQRDPAYLAINPQGLVPTLQDDAGAILTQSLAIIEWLDETHPEPPLLPKDPLRRAKVRAFAMALACDTHPVQNLKVLARLRELGLPEEQVTGWAAWANREGLAACENLIANEPGPFCFGSAPTIADLCLVPQLANARRFGVDVAAYTRLLKAEAAARETKAFADAAPDKQPDAEQAGADHDGRRLCGARLFVPPHAADRGGAVCRGVQSLRPDAGAICGAGGDPHPSRHRRDAAVGGDRVRPLDARQRDRAAGVES